MAGLTHPSDLYSIPPLYRETYTNVGNAVDFINAMHGAFWKGGPQYIAVMNVSDAAFQQICSGRDCEFSCARFMTARYFVEHGTLIVKFRHNLHVIVSDHVQHGLFCRFHKLRNQHVMIRPLGPNTQYLPGILIQPDVSYIPPTRPIEDGYPSIVIDVGNMDSLHILQAEAQLWLKNAGDLTMIVLLISISQANEQILIERWESENDTIKCVQQIMIDHRRNITTDAPLRLPLGLIFDDMPGAPSESSIEFSAHELMDIARKTFACVLQL